MTPRARLPRLVLGVAIAGLAIWLALDRDSLDSALIESSIHDLRLWAPLGHVVLFAVAGVRPWGGQDQAADLTVDRVCFSSNCCGLRYPSAE
jgi:uncharacterized membrane protein YdjX (TVP38/TMEM64 family)